MVSVDQLAFITNQASSLLASATTSRVLASSGGGSNTAAVAFVSKKRMSSYEHDSFIMPVVPTSSEESVHVDVNDSNDYSIGDEKVANTRQPIHFCFIVHGHNGRPTDLSYLHSTVKAKAKDMGLFTDAKSSESCVVGNMIGDGNTNVSADDSSENVVRRRGKRDRMPIKPNKNKLETNTNLHSSMNTDLRMTLNSVDGTGESKSTLIVHNAACNEGKTHDGIIKGGERLANEMLEVIRTEVKKQHNNYSNSLEQENDTEGEQQMMDVTISIVGNSLGGLYGRFAIAHLGEVLDSPAVDEPGNDDGDEKHQYYLLDGQIRLHLNVFCSTASPHLGCASHTYIPIPRTAEIGVAQVLGETGSDLFRLNNLLHEMATSPRFLRPLASFRKRIAYANLAWDFPVPGSTAAFLDGNSDSPHYFEEHISEAIERGFTETQVDNCPASEKGLIVATLYTPRLPLDASTAKDNKDNADSLAAMASSLDSLGWTKIFVDIRSEIPMAVSLPTLFNSDCPMSRLKSNKNPVVTSSDLEKAVSNSNWSRLGPPLGHNAICAFSRGTVSTIVNSGGRPVMDSLAMKLTNDISSWYGPDQDSVISAT